MIGRTNTGGGSGGGSLKDTDAVLNLTVPTGSSATMTKGGITLTPTIWTKNADNTLDCAIFSVPASTFDSNSWTVTATLGTESASNTIVIDSAEEYSIELSYRLYLYRAGDTSGWTAKGWKAHSQWTATAPTITYTTEYMGLTVGYHSGIAYYSEMIDLTDRSSITMHGDFNLTGSSVYGCGLYVLPNVTETGTLYENLAVAKSEFSLGTFTDYSLTVDVSLLVGSYYVAIGICRGSGNQYEVDGVYAQ